MTYMGLLPQNDVEAEDGEKKFPWIVVYMSIWMLVEVAFLRLGKAFNQTLLLGLIGLYVSTYLVAIMDALGGLPRHIWLRLTVYNAVSVFTVSSVISVLTCGKMPVVQSIMTVILSLIAADVIDFTVIMIWKKKLK